MNDMKKEYDEFIIENRVTMKTIKYPYIKGQSSKDVENQAIKEQMNLTNQPRSDFWISGLIKRSI